MVSRATAAGNNVAGYSVFKNYREQVSGWVAIMLTVILLPFTIKFILSGAFFSALAMMSVLVLSVSNALFMRQKKSPAISPDYIIVPVAVLMLGAVSESALDAVFWAYPSLLLFYVTVSRQLANVYSALIIILITFLMSLTADKSQLLPLVITLLMTAFFANVFIVMVLKLGQQLQTLATVDPLTGAQNRRAMEQQLDKILQLIQRFDGRYNLLLINIDNFKKVNEQHSYRQGDSVLKALVEIIRHNIRSIDSVYRVGGEEFAVLIQGGDADNGVFVADKLRQNINSMSYLPDGPLTVSIGVAEIKADETMDQLLIRVGEALSRAKTEGRNRVSKAE